MMRFVQLWYHKHREISRNRFDIRIKRLQVRHNVRGIQTTLRRKDVHDHDWYRRAKVPKPIVVVGWLVIGETELLLCNLHIDPWPLFWPLPRKMVQSSNYPSSKSPSIPYPSVSLANESLDSATVKLTCFKKQHVVTLALHGVHWTSSIGGLGVVQFL